VFWNRRGPPPTCANRNNPFFKIPEFLKTFSCAMRLLKRLMQENASQDKNKAKRKPQNRQENQKRDQHGKGHLHRT